MVDKKLYKVSLYFGKKKDGTYYVITENSTSAKDVVLDFTGADQGEYDSIEADTKVKKIKTSKVYLNKLIETVNKKGKFNPSGLDIDWKGGVLILHG